MSNSTVSTANPTITKASLCDCMETTVFSSGRLKAGAYMGKEIDGKSDTTDDNSSEETD